MAISITTNPADWQTGEAIVWTAVEAANDYAIEALERRRDQLDDILRSMDAIMGIETIEEEDTRLSFNAEIVLQRLQGVKISMDTDRHLEGITELAQKGIIQYNKKVHGWRVKK